MGQGIIGRAGVVICCLAAAVLSATAAPALKDKFCLDCHSDQTLFKTNAAGRGISMFVDRARLAGSVHHTNACITCHADVTAKHPDDNQTPAPVNCASCHQRESRSYSASVHGVARTAGEAGASTCQDCHGSHEILPVTSIASPLHVSRQAETCGECHDQEAHDWAASVHGKAVADG